VDRIEECIWIIIRVFTKIIVLYVVVSTVLKICNNRIVRNI
jgi:hypothetical protein